MRHVLGNVLLLIGALLTSGCFDLMSLHSLHTAQDRLVDPAIEGRWATDDGRLQIQKSDNTYLATYQDAKNSTEKVEYEVHLVDLNGVRFADVARTDDVVGHAILRVQVNGNELRLAFMDSEWLRGQVPHEDADLTGGSTLAMLTMSAADLRKMVTRFAREPRAFDEHEVVFRRAAAGR